MLGENGIDVYGSVLNANDGNRLTVQFDEKSVDRVENEFKAKRDGIPKLSKGR